MISQFESFLCPDKRVTPEEGQRILQLKHCVSNYQNKNEDNNLKNHKKKNTHQASSQKFRQIIISITAI